MSKILGISCFYHDSAAVLIDKGEIIEAVQEERFTRKKHDLSFPHNSIKYILKQNNLNLDNIDYIVFYEKPFLKFERLIETYLANAPRGFLSFKKSLPIWVKEKLFQKKILLDDLKKISNSEIRNRKLLFSEHHLSHAASAFFPSPFKESIIITADGVGEWTTTTIAIGKENNIKIVKEIYFPHSLGLLYSAFTYYIGFKVNSGEYKLMGLAPYGSPIYKDIIFRELIDVKEDGSFRINQKYFNYASGLTMTNLKFSNLFGIKVREAESEKLSQFHMDIAASIQEVIEEIMLKICRYAKNKYKIDNLCLAGGIALNCVANGKIYKENIFENIWIQPAAGDSGGALGAALMVWYNQLNNSRNINSNDSMKGSYLGPQYTNSEIENVLSNLGAKFNKLSNDEITSYTAKLLSEGKAIAWFQGRMEFGPRALGSRSILGDPRSPDMQKNLNLKVKFRESFRPFAPSILREDLSEWFELKADSPYMLLTSNIKENKIIKMTEDEKKLFGIDKLNIKRSSVPAITHINYSARIQTVTIEENERYYNLIKEFKKITGCPILVNTSFNVRGEPIVLSPYDAYKCFMGTELDILVIGNYLLHKNVQDQTNIEIDYKNSYKLD